MFSHFKIFTSFLLFSPSYYYPHPFIYSILPFIMCLASPLHPLYLINLFYLIIHVHHASPCLRFYIYISFFSLVLFPSFIRLFLPLIRFILSFTLIRFIFSFRVYIYRLLFPFVLISLSPLHFYLWLFFLLPHTSFLRPFLYVCILTHFLPPLNNFPLFSPTFLPPTLYPFSLTLLYFPLPT